MSRRRGDEDSKDRGTGKDGGNVRGGNGIENLKQDRG